MKKKGRTGRIFAALGLILVWLAGFLLGFDSGRIMNDSSRIRRALEASQGDTGYRLPLTAKSTTGQKETEALNAYLAAFDDCARELEDCREELQKLAGGVPDSSQSGASLKQRNEDAFRAMEDLVRHPERFLEQYTSGDEDAQIWMEDWVQDLKAADHREALEETWQDVYEENQRLAGETE